MTIGEHSFYIASMFIPRLTILFAWFISDGVIPKNPIPFWGDIILSIFVPRILITIYAMINGEIIYGIIHFILFIFMFSYTRSDSNSV